MMRGSLRFQTMPTWVLSPSLRKRMRAMSATEMCTEPVLMFQTVKAARAMSSPTITAA